MSDIASVEPLPVRLALDISSDGDSPSVPEYSALYVQFADGSFERVCFVQTLILDYYGDRHQRLEPQFALYLIDGKVAVQSGSEWYERQTNRAEYRLIDASAPAAAEMSERAARLATIGPPVKADAEAMTPYYSLPQHLVIEGGASDETERIFGKNMYDARVELGYLRAIVPADPRLKWPHASLFVLNEGTLVIIHDDNDNIEPTLWLFKVGGNAFERVEDASLRISLLASVRRRKEPTYRTPLGNSKADRH